jgi:hypothetical protein
VVGICIRKPDHYTRDTKLTVITAVEPGDPNRPPLQDGRIERPRHWIWVRMITGTNAATFSDFCEYICSSIEQSRETSGSSTAFHQQWHLMRLAGDPTPTEQVHHGPFFRNTEMARSRQGLMSSSAAISTKDWEKQKMDWRSWSRNVD